MKLYSTYYFVVFTLLFIGVSGSAGAAKSFVVGERFAIIPDDAQQSFLMCDVSEKVGGRLSLFSSQDAPIPVSFRKISTKEGAFLGRFDGGVMTVGISGDTLLIQVQHSQKRPMCLVLAAQGGSVLPSRLLSDRESDQRVVSTRIGNAAVQAAQGFFFPEHDTALHFEARKMLSWRDAHQLACIIPPNSDAPVLRLQWHGSYYRNTLEIPNYTVMHPRSFWKTAPVVALTWFGIEGWNGKHAQRKEWLFPQIDWVAEKLLPFAGSLVFQIDDNYPYEDNAYMRSLSDYIRKKGLVPGIWFAPFAVAPVEAVTTHPEAFLQDAEGGFLTAFGGVNWRNPATPGPDTFVLNTENAQAVSQWYAPFWEKVSNTWNFDFFKIDAQPTVANRYRRAKNGGGISGYRAGLQRGRDIVGEDRFINGCYGIPLDAMGIADGARTGPDASGWVHAMEVILKWQFLNRICWWCDPDAAGNQHKAALSTVRLNAQARVLTGQQFVMDDVWTEASDALTRIWQQSMPVLDIWPVNLYPIKGNWTKYDLLNLHVDKAERQWNVVGLFNYYAKSKQKQLDLNRLNFTQGQVHIYEFWSRKYVGCFAHDAAIDWELPPHDAALFSIIHDVPDRPLLLSTDRHLSQGALELEKLAWEKQDAQTWSVSGASSHLVAGHPYELSFLHRGYTVQTHETQGECAIQYDGPLCRIRITPESSAVLSWRFVFNRSF